MTIKTYAEKNRFFDQKIQTTKFFEIIDLKWYLGLEYFCLNN